MFKVALIVARCFLRRLPANRQKLLMNKIGKRHAEEFHRKFDIKKEWGEI